MPANSLTLLFQWVEINSPPEYEPDEVSRLQQQNVTDITMCDFEARTKTLPFTTGCLELLTLGEARNHTLRTL